MSGPSYLITGVAGFIGSNLLEFLLNKKYKVTGIDNFITGHQENLNEVKDSVQKDLWKNFTFIEGDITESKFCNDITRSCDIVLHQAALGSVPRSIENPRKTFDINVKGFQEIIEASRINGVKRFIFASSSSVYGDHPELPKIEENVGKVLSPYALSKKVNELIAEVYNETYGFNYIGLRYFNVFGKNQDPNGVYAAVIPKWINSVKNNQSIKINGDGTNSRDFCHINNVVIANYLASRVDNNKALNKIYNIACGKRTNLLELSDLIIDKANLLGSAYDLPKEFQPSRKGDISHSHADINKAMSLLNYKPLTFIDDGIEDTVNWFLNKKDERI